MHEWIEFDCCEPDTHPANLQPVFFETHVSAHNDACIGYFRAPTMEQLVTSDGRETGVVCDWGTFFCQHGFFDWEDVIRWKPKYDD